jgi:ornithine cyclodeaminase/alanine dehydrogenase-like protein (mu-crystallin family)
MLVLNAQEVRKALPMGECIAAMKKAYSALSAGKAEVPLRMRLNVKPHDGMSIFMPAFVEEENSQALAVKIVSLFTNNPSKGLPLIQAAVLMLDEETGSVEALIEGASLTAIRTGAGCGAATDVLARNDAKTFAIFGVGVQSRTQLEAVCTVRQIETVWVYSPNSEQVKVFIAEMAGRGPIPRDIRAANDPQEAVAEAEIISAATTSHTPVFPDRDVKQGTHINAAGTHTADGIEIPEETIARSRITVDSRAATRVESGEIAIPLQNKLITESDVVEIGEVFLGKAAGRTSLKQITFFKSVGVAVQDALAGRLALENAQRMDLGTKVAW